MKNRILFGIIGGGLVIGTAVYMLIKYMGKATADNRKPHNENSLDFSNVEIVASDTDSIEKSRTQSARSIYNRHKEAAELIREAMDVNEFLEVPSEHKDEFDSMLDELDILSEER